MHPGFSHVAFPGRFLDGGDGGARLVLADMEAEGGHRPASSRDGRRRRGADACEVVGPVAPVESVSGQSGDMGDAPVAVRDGALADEVIGRRRSSAVGTLADDADPVADVPVEPLLAVVQHVGVGHSCFRGAHLHGGVDPDACFGLPVGPLTGDDGQDGGR